jgi:exodeoxyribonuclease-5
MTAVRVARRPRKLKSAIAPIAPAAPAQLNEDQARAVSELRTAIDRGDPVCRLLGFAGTGKSFSIVRLLKVYAPHRPVLLTAPTNKAAAVLRAMAAEIGGKVEANTIHKVLGLRPQLDEDRGHYILKRVRQPAIEEGALIVVDECSMVDTQLLRFITQAAQAARAQILFVGDPAQLPPIFEAESPAFSGPGVTARLTQIVRQKADHPILGMTQLIRDAMKGGDVPRFETKHSGDGSLIHLDAPAFESAMLAAMHSTDYQADSDHCRVLCWTNGKTDHYNRLIRRSLLGPPAEQQALLPGEVVVACNPILELGISIGDSVTVINAAPDLHHSIPCLKARIANAKGKQLDVWVVRPDGREAYKLELSRLAKVANLLQSEFNDHRNGNTLSQYPQLSDKRRKAAWVQFFEFKDEAFADLRPPESRALSG